MRRRVERAKALLAASDLTITEICFAVGFQSPPQEQPYGIEAIVQDPFGNWFSMIQHRAFEM